MTLNVLGAVGKRHIIIRLCVQFTVAAIAEALLPAGFC